MTAICQKKNKGMRAWLRKNAVGYAFLMPFLVLFAIFVIVPVGEIGRASCRERV